MGSGAGGEGRLGREGGGGGEAGGRAPGVGQLTALQLPAWTQNIEIKAQEQSFSVEF